MRPLTLHASALNDEEYELYTASLRDLDDHLDTAKHDDAYYEGMQIGVREVRGWMRGKYAHLQPGILRFFAPGLGHADVLTGGQFFAALRLVVHVEQGKHVDRSLGFVQAHPAPPKVAPTQLPVSPHSPHNPFVARVPPLPPRKPAPQPLAPPPKHASKSTPPVHHAPLPPPPHHPPVAPKPTHVTSALIKQSLQASKAAQTMKRAEAQLERERVLQVLKSSSVVSTLSGARVERSSVVVGTSVRTTQHNHHNYSSAPPSGEASPSISSSESVEGRAPPLPRRRNTHQQQSSPPVSASSLEQVALARTPSEPTQAPLTDHHISGAPMIPTPPLPPMRSSTNPFPVSNACSSNTNNPYRHPSTSYTASPQSSPPRGTADLPPPMHPDRLPSTSNTSTPSAVPSPLATNDSEGSPTTRVFRSKSLHHPSPPPIPSLPAAPPRRRPESVQVLAGMGDKNSLTSMPLSRQSSNSALVRGPHKRQASLSASLASMGLERDKETQERQQQEKDWESPLGKFARSWQPRLEKARYKAEAGLTRRGFVRTGDNCDRSRSKGPEETEDLLASSPFNRSKKDGRLAGGWQGRGYGYGHGDYDPPSVDGSADAASDGSSPHRSSERDELKWPVGEGEGWRPL
ncbi:hypothetical protein C0995_010489 [Termitomyces sp. Mi166|nr:hypothetical protein C0995_010489 [Termitomyces sp. Mi166\